MKPPRNDLVNEQTRSIESSVQETQSITTGNIQDGEAFVASVDFGEIASNGGNAVISFTTSGDEEVHLRKYELTATEGPGEFILYEGADTTNGTSIDPNNLRRTGDVDAPDVDIFEGAVINSRGEQLSTSRITGDKAGGALENTAVEWILAQNTTYVIEYVNESNNNSRATFEMLWYEVSI